MADELSIESGNDTVRNKIVFVGDVFVGKTTVMSRFTENNYKENYDPTVGVDFFSKEIHYKGKCLILQIWDTAGQEKYKSLIPSYVRGASIIFIIYDVSIKIKVILEKETFTNIGAWINFIKSVKVDNTMIVLCGNKIDLERQVSSAEGEKLAIKENLIFFEVSAKTNTNVKKMFLSALADLPFFDQFNKPKEKIIQELGLIILTLEEENRDKDLNEGENNENSKKNKASLFVVGKKEEVSNKNSSKCKC